jgi:hypothetical protein
VFSAASPSTIGDPSDKAPIVDPIVAVPIAMITDVRIPATM